MLTAILQDLRYALRQLRRSPGFALTAILTLGLGIGAATIMDSIIHSTLLAPLPYPAQEQLVGVGLSTAGTDPNAEQTGETATFLAAHSSSFSSSGVADDGPLGQNFSIGDGHPRTVRSLRVSAGYLPTLGIAPLLGRTFTLQEDLPGAAPAAILSEALWRSALNADPHVLGRAIHINADLYTVIGVMPSSASTVDAPDIWQPLHLSPDDPGYHGDNFQFIARLKPGVILAQLSAELGPLTQAMLDQYPSYHRWGPPGAPPMHEIAWPLQRVVVSNARSSVISLSAAVLAVLLVACLNLAGLVIARASARRYELALRSALGASRASVLRLLLSESLLLALGGSVLGLGLAGICLPVLVANAPFDLPALHHIGIGLGSAAFALATGLATTLVFGLIPVLGAFRPSVSAALGATRAAGASVSQNRLGRSLIVAQVALAATLLSAAALLLGTFLNMRAIPSGVRPQNLSLLQVNLKGTAYYSSAHTQQFIAAVENRLRQIPGVSDVATVNGLPLDRGLNNSGYPVGHKELFAYVETRFVTPGYFHTAGTILLAGNDISTSDTVTSQPVALINQRAATLGWPNRIPLGEYVIDGGGSPLRIVGIVADAHDRALAGTLRPTVYLPYAQVSDRTVKMINGWFPTTFLLRTHASHSNAAMQPDPALALAAAAAVVAADPEVSVGRFAPMQSLIDHSIAAPRFFSSLAGGFALFALLLTIIGLFGLLSYQVASRTRELGIRMALGASRQRILTGVLGSGMTLTALGLVMGTLGGLALRRSVTALISDTARVDLSSVNSILGNQAAALAIAAGLMLLASVAASLLPARRAASIEPTEALRAE